MAITAAKNFRVYEDDFNQIKEFMETEGIESNSDFMHLVAENLNKLVKKDSEPDEKIKQEEEEKYQPTENLMMTSSLKKSNFKLVDAVSNLVEVFNDRMDKLEGKNKYSDVPVPEIKTDIDGVYIDTDRISFPGIFPDKTWEVEDRIRYFSLAEKKFNWLQYWFMKQVFDADWEYEFNFKGDKKPYTKYGYINAYILSHVGSLYDPTDKMFRDMPEPPVLYPDADARVSNQTMIRFNYTDQYDSPYDGAGGMCQYRAERILWGMPIPKDWRSYNEKHNIGPQDKR